MRTPVSSISMLRNLGGCFDNERMVRLVRSLKFEFSTGSHGSFWNMYGKYH